MTNNYTAVFKKAGEWWVGWVEELPGALAQERTLEEARSSLREAISDIVRANREFSRKESSSESTLRETLAVTV